MSGHRPVRPEWICSCGRLAWPCAKAREQLLREFEGNRKALITMLVVRLAEAARDLPEEPAADLAARIVGWAWPAVPARPAGHGYVSAG